MTKLDNDGAALTGEQRFKAKRRKWWQYLTIAFVVALIAGMAGGYTTGMFESGEIPVWIPLIVWAIIVIGWAWFSRDYFRRIDELDLMDNLWAHMIGLYGGLAFCMTWFMLSELDLTGEPQVLPAIGSMLVITFIAYGIRKLGFR